MGDFEKNWLTSLKFWGLILILSVFITGTWKLTQVNEGDNPELVVTWILTWGAILVCYAGFWLLGACFQGVSEVKKMEIYNQLVMENFKKNEREDIRNGGIVKRLRNKLKEDNRFDGITEEKLEDEILDILKKHLEKKAEVQS